MPRASKDQDPPGDDGPSGRNADVNFHGQKRSNETHVSKTDPDSRLAKKGKGKEAKLSYCGHLMTENRYGLIVNAEVTTTTGTAERDATALMLKGRSGKKQIALGADKNYDTRDFNKAAERINAHPTLIVEQIAALMGERRGTRVTSLASENVNG